VITKGASRTLWRQPETFNAKVLEFLAQK